MKEPKIETLKINGQFRDGRGMGYDLKCGTQRLTVRIAPKDSAEGAGAWRVEARTTDASVACVVAEGATKAAALDDVARSWKGDVSAGGLPSVDWEAVHRELTAVRAL